MMLEFANVARTIASTARRVLTASVLGAGDPGDDGTAERVDDCEVVQPLGLYARPALTALTEALVARLGDRPLVVALLDKSRPAQAVEEGEVRLYGVGQSNAAAVIRVRADGSIEITSLNNTNVTVTASGSGEVRVNGSAVKIAADADPVDLGAWSFSPGTGGASLSYTPPGGSSTPITAATPVTGKIAVSAARRAKTSA